MSETKNQTPNTRWPEGEVKVALKLTLLLLVLLTLSKSFLGSGWFASICYTGLVAFQLYIPIWRAEKNGSNMDLVGLHFKNWQVDLKLVSIWCALTLPAFALCYHFFITKSFELAATWDLGFLLPYLPRPGASANFTNITAEGPFLILTWLEISAIHLLGVALPEETFYRGYLQPLLETIFPPRYRFFGVFLGKGAILAAVLFALGHFLGEWNPLRFGPFLPALAFAWLRNGSGSCIGAITFHGICNIFSEFLFRMYNPID